MNNRHIIHNRDTYFCVNVLKAYDVLCLCVEGIYIFCVLGTYCEEDVDECEKQICLNGGTCKNINGGFLCVCVNGWTGTHCEENIDDCINKPCFNGGTCIDRVGYFSCDCPVGRTGKLKFLKL
jgi:hypothetical protein